MDLMQIMQLLKDPDKLRAIGDQILSDVKGHLDAGFAGVRANQDAIGGNQVELHKQVMGLHVRLARLEKAAGITIETEAEKAAPKEIAS